MNKALLKWSPAVPMKRPDNIISSKAKEKNQLGFKPSYENEPQEHMRLLLSNEYMRIWFNERAVYEKDTYTREKIIKEENKIKRRFVQRMMTYRKPTKNQFIEEDIEKRRQDARLLSKPHSNTPNYEKMKYKTECYQLGKLKKPTKSGPEDSNRNRVKGSKVEKPVDKENADYVEADISCECHCP